LLADGPGVQGHSSISDLINQADETDLLPGEILKAIPANARLRQITVAKCIAKNGRIHTQWNCYVPAGDQLQL
jgi:hypothetical protein